MSILASSLDAAAIRAAAKLLGARAQPTVEVDAAAIVPAFTDRNSEPGLSNVIFALAAAIKAPKGIPRNTTAHQEMEDWLGFVETTLSPAAAAARDVPDNVFQALAPLQDHLRTRARLAGAEVTLADAALLPFLRFALDTASDTQIAALPAVVRYYNFLATDLVARRCVAAADFPLRAVPLTPIPPHVPRAAKPRGRTGAR